MPKRVATTDTPASAPKATHRGSVNTRRRAHFTDIPSTNVGELLQVEQRVSNVLPDRAALQDFMTLDLVQVGEVGDSLLEPRPLLLRGRTSQGSLEDIDDPGGGRWVGPGNELPRPGVRLLEHERVVEQGEGL